MEAPEWWQPVYKVFAVISKYYTDDKYSYITKLDKVIDLKEYYFSEEIENLIERTALSIVWFLHLILKNFILCKNGR